MHFFIPSYIKLLESGELKERVDQALKLLEDCIVCARYCHVNRLKGELGVCKVGRFARVASYGPHHGEEDVLRGWSGSGTIFFSGCSLSCQYCQNFSISQDPKSGYEVTAKKLADMMLELQHSGCHNINLVTPSHVVPQILEAVYIAAQKGLSLPLVYNTGGYDSIEMLKILDGIIDIYMPDMKYADEKLARKYSKVKDYPQINQKAVLEMHRQVGDLIVNDEGLAVKGLLIRHLVLPNHIGGTKEIMHFIATKISKNTYLNIMDQYFPSYKAYKYPEINRSITKEEFEEAIRAAHDEGLYRLDKAEVL